MQQYLLLQRNLVYTGFTGAGVAIMFARSSAIISDSECPTHWR